MLVGTLGGPECTVVGERESDSERVCESESTGLLVRPGISETQKF